MSVRDARVRVAALADAQHGVLSRRQMLGLGLTRSMIETGLGTGRLTPLHPGVYALGHRRLRREGSWLAAVLWAGPGAALSHREAAALHGLRASSRSRTDVTTARRMRRPPPGIETHHTSTLPAEDRSVAEGIPVTSVARTLVDLAGVVARDSLAKALREAEHLRVVDVRDIHAAMDRTSNRPGPGYAALEAVLAEHRRRGTQLTRSVLEERFVALCDRHGLPPPRTNFYIVGMEVDACWPTHRLAVELDGWDRHKDRHAFQHDRQKGNAITHAGYRLLRFTHDDIVNRPTATAAQIAGFLEGA
jgi:predicted transcriptional regulator of viral defense system